MPRCEGGHQTGLTMRCEACGSPVLYSRELEELASLPRPEVKYEDVSILFCGVTPFAVDVDDAYSGVVEVGEKEERLPSKYTLKGIKGGTWLDYARGYVKGVRSWLELVGLYRSRAKVIILDASDPLAVLLLGSLRSTEGTVIIAKVADEGSTPMEQNTSYVAYELIVRKGFLAILASASRVSSMAMFSEEEGLVSGDVAFREVVRRLVGSLDFLEESMRRDLRLGIRVHYISSIMGASDQVFKAPSGAMEVLRSQLPSSEAGQGTILSAYLIGAADGEHRDGLSSAFSDHLRMVEGLLTSGIAIGEKKTALGLYDLIAIYGVKGARLLDGIKEGYEVVKGHAPDLGVEGIEALI